MREFTFNEESTESYIETIDECSMMESFDQEDEQHLLSDLRDEPTSFYFQELQSTYVSPMQRSSSAFAFVFVLLDMSNDNAIDRCHSLTSSSIFRRSYSTSSSRKSRRPSSPLI